MAIFTLNWSPVGGPNSLNQTARYREKGSVTWLTTGFSPANPIGPLVSTTEVSGLLDNTIYEFQIVNNCNFGGSATSDIFEEMVYACIGGFSYEDNGDGTATFEIVGLDSLPDINLVRFEIYDSTQTFLLATSPNVATGSPTTWTTGVLAEDDYIVKIQYGAIINGIQQFSNFGASTCRYPFSIET
jgi:hypothetical protein